jgi:hypothetical protein
MCSSFWVCRTWKNGKRKNPPETGGLSARRCGPKAGARLGNKYEVEDEELVLGRRLVQRLLLCVELRILGDIAEVELQSLCILTTKSSDKRDSYIVVTR